MSTPESSNSKQGTSWILLHMLWLFLLACFLCFPFLTHAGDTGIITCRFHQLTGLSCPTCGMSRSLYEFTHLHVLASFKMHLFGPLTYLLALGLFVKLAVELVSGKPVLTSLTSNMIKKGLFSLATLWIVYWLIRMTIEWVRL